MLTEAFHELSPRLAARYRGLLGRELEASPELSALHRDYLAYAQLDKFLPRPVLAYFGYHVMSSHVPFIDVDDIGDGLLIPQLLRDFLAIHDDVVDEDLVKFGAAPLPVTFSGSGAQRHALTKAGKDLAIYYGDLVFAVLLNVTRRQPEPVRSALVDLITATLYTNQRGQLAELLAQQRPLSETTVEDVLLFAEHKAAHYCYEFPFTVGAILAGHPLRTVETERNLLVGIGIASQVIDDITGAFPYVVDDDKDALGEIINLRRTIPMVLLAGIDTPPAIRTLMNSRAPIRREDAETLRTYMWASQVPAQAATLCASIVAPLRAHLASLPPGRPSTVYLSDLIEHRLTASLDRLTSARPVT